MPLGGIQTDAYLIISGQPVATAMGGMGRQFDGSYAEYTCVPAVQVQAINIDTPLQMVVNEVQGKRMTPRIGRVFHLDDIVEAHRCMEDNSAGGKIVVLT